MRTLGFAELHEECTSLASATQNRQLNANSLGKMPELVTSDERRERGNDSLQTAWTRTEPGKEFAQPLNR